MYILLSLLAFVPRAFAQNPCAGITGCTAGANQLVPAIVAIASLLVQTISGLAVLGVVVGGAFMVLNLGNDSTATRGRNGVIFSLIAFALALSSQAIVSFVVANMVLVDAANPHIDAMRIVIAGMLRVFNVVFALMMLYYGYKLVIGRGQQGELDAVKKGLAWTIGGAVTVNLGYALVNATYALFL